MYVVLSRRYKGVMKDPDFQSLINNMLKKGCIQMYHPGAGGMSNTRQEKVIARNASKRSLLIF
jgi:hypothetical protein